MTKYATLTKYQPYIDVIMKDLGLTDKVVIDWVFGHWTKKGGDAKLYSALKYDGLFRGCVRIDKCSSHDWTIQAIMHELKHIQQYVEGRLSVHGNTKYKMTKRGKYISEYYKIWNGKEVRYYGLKMDVNGNPNDEYMNNPWEIEAYAYMKEDKRLFPNNKLPAARKHVGTVGKVKFYKMVKG